MRPFEELFSLSKDLYDAAGVLEGPLDEPLSRLADAANQVDKSFSGSWLGYHSRVYYRDFIPPPAGDHFSQEWGLQDLLGDIGSGGDWQEFNGDFVRGQIRLRAGSPDLGPSRSASVSAAKTFERAKAEMMSILGSELEEKDDRFLQKLLEELEPLTPMSAAAVAQRWSPQARVMTRDAIASGQGFQTPPHIEILADVAAIRHSFSICEKAAGIASKAASHLERKSRRQTAMERVGTNVFIGHGRSGAWRELKDFVQDRLRLPWDEFNRVPVAGVTNIARLSQMLDAAAIAFLVMTAEDELADGAMQARMNVIHEAGLFQGRLGFERAIVLLEEGCEEFSNIQGLGQIRFPKGNIGAAFEAVRQVLEREKIITET